MIIKTPNFQPGYKNDYSFLNNKYNYNPLTMIPCGIFETQISAHMLRNQFRHTTSQDLEVYIQSKYLYSYLTHYINKFIQLYISCQWRLFKNKKSCQLISEYRRVILITDRTCIVKTLPGAAVEIMTLL